MRTTPAIAPSLPALLSSLLPLLLLCAAGSSPAFAQTLNVKPGAWEMSYKSAALPRAASEKECITQADIAQLAAGPDKDDDTDCKLAKPAVVSGNRWSADKTCPDGRKVRAEFVAETPERVKGTVVSSAGKGGGATMTIEISGRWLGASCAGIK